MDIDNGREAMTEKYLSNDEIRDIFYASMCAAAIEKRAAGQVPALLAGVGATKLMEMLGSGVKNTTEGYLKLIPAAAMGSLLVGGSVGGLYNTIKDRITDSGDERIDADMKLESLYKARTEELKDREWMAKVRKMRNDLRGGMKKMTPEEYEKSYNALSEALDERRG